MSNDYTEHINFKEKVHIFYIGFDLLDNGFAQDKVKFYDELFKDIPSFAFGPMVSKDKFQSEGEVATIREACRSLYAIPEIKLAQEKYLGSADTEDKYIKRGEFGELILYHLLHEYFGADALISKIYFKDSKNIPAHGFDAVHVDVDEQVLWLGESKLYKSGPNAIDELVKDVVGYIDKDGVKHGGHFSTDFFNSEFQIITNRIHDSKYEYSDFVKTLINPNTKTLDKLARINIALFAGFESKVLKSYGTQEFEKELTTEINKLKNRANKGLASHPWINKLNLYLFLFPIENKKELVLSLHNKLKGAQLL